MTDRMSDAGERVLYESVIAEAADRLEQRDAEIERLKAVVMEQGIKTGLLLGALSEIDDLAVSHTKGAIGKAQKIARAALRTHTLPSAYREGPGE